MFKKKNQSKDSILMRKNHNLVVEIVKKGKRWNAFDQQGNVVRGLISTTQRKKAFKKKMGLKRLFYKDGRPYWRLVPMSEFKSKKSSVVDTATREKMTAMVLPLNPSDYSTDTTGVDVSGVYTPIVKQSDVIEFIRSSYELKPSKVMIGELKWKHLIRTIIRGKNTMVTGMQGCGKTLVVKSAAFAIGRPYFMFNLGETQDPKSYLLGNTHFNKDTGTVFYPSRFIRAIQTRGAIIHLDEISRAHPDAWNILMSILDPSQRYAILDEARDSAVVKVAEGVTFVATANIGSEFTATRVMDRALMDRFTFVEMDILTKEQETELLELMFPTLNKTLLVAIAEIATTSREEIKSSSPKLSTAISTRISVETASLLYDGFTLSESAELALYPFFSDDGGLDSERTYVRQLVQRFDDDNNTSMPFGQSAIDNAP